MSKEKNGKRGAGNAAKRAALKQATETAKKKAKGAKNGNGKKIKKPAPVAAEVVLKANEIVDGFLPEVTGEEVKKGFLHSSPWVGRMGCQCGETLVSAKTETMTAKDGTAFYKDVFICTSCRARFTRAIPVRK